MIISRESITRQAHQAARDELAGRPTQNPYMPGTDAHACWQADYTRAWHELTAEQDCEASA